MKIFIVILLAALAFLAYKFLSPAPPKPAPMQQAAQQETARPAPPSKGKQMLQEAGSVIDYGMGATQLRAKKNATGKIQQLQNQHNQELDKALQD